MSNELKNNQANKDEMPAVSNQQLQEQIVLLQEQFVSLRDEVTDSNKELHKTKHSMEGIEANFLGFTKLFDRYYQKLDQIHESLLVGQFSPRLTKLEAMMEAKAAEVLTTKNDLVMANTILNSEFNAVRTRLSALDAQIQQKEMQIIANAKELDALRGWKSNIEGRLVIIGIIWPIMVGVISFILSHYYK